MPALLSSGGPRPCATVCMSWCSRATSCPTPSSTPPSASTDEDPAPHEEPWAPCCRDTAGWLARTTREKSLPLPRRTCCGFDPEDPRTWQEGAESPAQVASRKRPSLQVTLRTTAAPKGAGLQLGAAHQRLPNPGGLRGPVLLGKWPCPARGKPGPSQLIIP